jgi:PQQ-dependent catabolism-associated CXXCW motif protein
MIALRNKWAAVLLVCLAASGSARAQPPGAERAFAEEDRDWGIAPTSHLRQQPYHAPTPREIPGAQVVSTGQLLAMLTSADPPVIVDVLSGEGHLTLAGAKWLPGAGHGSNFLDPVQAILTQLLVQLTGGDKARPVVFFCANSECWLSYNAALRATVAGYSKIYWYRGGVDAWVEAGFPTMKMPARR